MKKDKDFLEGGANYMRLKTRSPFSESYLFVDVEDYVSVPYFASRGVKARVSRVFERQGFEYLFIICRVPRRQAAEFCHAMEDTAHHFLLNGHPDYLDVCRDMFSLFDKK